MSRPSWERYFMDMATVAASRSSCSRRQVGSVIVVEKSIVSTGYNGTPRGATHCNEGGCPRCAGDAASGSNLAECLCCHAEENAIVQAARRGNAIEGGTLFTTYAPCLQCAKMIVNAGIRRVFYQHDYPSAGNAASALLVDHLELCNLKNSERISKAIGISMRSEM